MRSLDTNVISEVMRPEPAAQVRHWLLQLTDDRLVTTVVTIAETEYGIARLAHGKRREDLARRFAELTGPGSDLAALPLDEPAAHVAGHLRHERERKGLGAYFADMTIAAIALNANAALATRNVDDFGAIGLEIVNPWESAG